MKEIFVERRESILRIAIKNYGVLNEFIIEEEKNGPKIGEIYKGKVKNIINGTNSIFVDIGLNKEAYLYYSEELKKQDIKKGTELIVEIIKEPINNKGAKVTTNFAISSKYMVLESKGKGIDFSKRFKDEIKKEIIKAELREVENARLILRTNSAEASIEELEYERNTLIKEYEEIIRKMNYSSVIGKIYGDNLVLNKVLRDKIALEKSKIILNDKDDYEFTKKYLENQEYIKIEFYDEMQSMFKSYNIEKELLKLRHNKVILPCGGSIYIEKTEAMYTIDVNTGSNIKERSFEKTILQTNIEAAKEIGRQILVRNLSGIIVVDFIDLRQKGHRNLVLKELKESLKEDIGNMKIFPFTELDLVQISRKRRGKSIYDYMEEKCCVCLGEGRLLKLSYIENLIYEEILSYEEQNGINDFLIEIDEVYKEKIIQDITAFLINTGTIKKEVYIKYINNLDGYRIEPLIFENQKKNIQEFKIEL